MKLNLAIKLNNTDALNSRVFPYNFNAEVKLCWPGKLKHSCTYLHTLITDFPLQPTRGDYVT